VLLTQRVQSRVNKLLNKLSTLHYRSSAATWNKRATHLSHLDSGLTYTKSSFDVHLCSKLKGEAVIAVANSRCISAL